MSHQSAEGPSIPRFDVYIPQDLDDALNYLAANPNETLPIASGTDLIPRIKRKKVSARNLLDLSGLTELRYVKRDQGRVRIGALTTIADLEKQAERSVWCRALGDAARTFGSPNIRSIATVGGNICAASSSEDLIPVFLALDAKVKIIAKHGPREQSLEEFIVEKRKTSLDSDELLAEVSFPEPSERSAFSFKKLGMRNILIIAIVSAAVFLEINSAQSRIATARIALNRLRGKIPQRAATAERYLLNRRLNEKSIESATSALVEELSLTSDLRASANYRCEAAKVLANRALLDCQAQLSRK